MKGMPEVSLITSWHAGCPRCIKMPGEADLSYEEADLPSGEKEENKETLPGLQYALKAGLKLFDLYFLNPLELPWYLAQLDSPEGRWTKQQASCPLRFAAGLTPEEITRLADALTLELTGPFYTGRLIGPRPRFVALATYWPLIADDSPENRNLSIKAVQNSILLAEKLGCEHVEIVGGAAFSGQDGRGASTAGERVQLADDLRKDRMQRLAKSLLKVFSGQVGEELLGRQGRSPKLCVEMEPGSAFLVRDIRTFHELYQKLHKSIRSRVMLNVDLAHMFLADVEAHTSQSPQESQLDYLTNHPEVKDLIGHFHCSDHARSHAADLCPGTYHFWQRDYKPWLELAVERVGKPGFSNAIAIEMEAVTDIHEVTRAIGRTRAWLKSLLGEEQRHQEVTGIIMAVDIANSTRVLARGGVNVEKGARRLDAAVSGISRLIQKHRGSVYSFTGDGVVAVFDAKHFLTPAECARCAITAGDRLYEAMREELDALDEWDDLHESRELAVRVAMHWGLVQIPSHGPLKHQVLGANVIFACRMLALSDGVLGGSPEAAVMTHQIAVSESIKVMLSEPDQAPWNKLPRAKLREFRGLDWATCQDELKALYLKDGSKVQSA